MDRFTSTVTAGALVGTLTAIGGATKDAPYEGFDFSTFLRSPVLTALWAVVLGEAFPRVPVLPVALAAVGAERLTVELYKLGRIQQETYVAAKYRVGEWGQPHWSERKP